MNRDGTGPRGKGPKTGRGKGPCKGPEKKGKFGKGLGEDEKLGKGFGIKRGK